MCLCICVCVCVCVCGCVCLCLCLFPASSSSASRARISSSASSGSHSAPSSARTSSTGTGSISTTGRLGSASGVPSLFAVAPEDPAQMLLTVLNRVDGLSEQVAKSMGLLGSQAETIKIQKDKLGTV